MAPSAEYAPLVTELLFCTDGQYYHIHKGGRRTRIGKLQSGTLSTYFTGIQVNFLIWTDHTSSAEIQNPGGRGRGGSIKPEVWFTNTGKPVQDVLHDKAPLLYKIHTAESIKPTFDIYKKVPDLVPLNIYGSYDEVLLQSLGGTGGIGGAYAKVLNNCYTHSYT